MNITRDLEFESELINRIAKREFTERIGVHSTDLVYCLNKQALRRVNPLPTNKHDLLLYSVGFSTQAWLSSKFKDAKVIEVDRIIVTPDALACPSCGEVVE